MDAYYFPFAVHHHRHRRRRAESPSFQLSSLPLRHQFLACLSAWSVSLPHLSQQWSMASPRPHEADDADHVFPFFPRFPLEIRWMIWEYCLPTASLNWTPAATGSSKIPPAPAPANSRPRPPPTARPPQSHVSAARPARSPSAMPPQGFGLLQYHSLWRLDGSVMDADAAHFFASTIPQHGVGPGWAPPQRPGRGRRVGLATRPRPRSRPWPPGWPLAAPEAEGSSSTPSPS